MNLFTDNTIEKGVMSIVRAKIADAQAEFNQETKRLDKEAVDAHKNIKTKLVTDKKSLADSLIKRVVGKLL